MNINSSEPTSFSSKSATVPHANSLANITPAPSSAQHVIPAVNVPSRSTPYSNSANLDKARVSESDSPKRDIKSSGCIYRRCVNNDCLLRATLNRAHAECSAKKASSNGGHAATSSNAARAATVKDEGFCCAVELLEYLIYRCSDVESFLASCRQSFDRLD